MKDSISKVVFIYIIAIITISCNNKKGEFSLNQAGMPSKKSRELALKKGDTNAYHELSIEYMDSPNNPGFLETAVTMADKYKYHEAYLDVYYVLTDYYHRRDNRNLDDLDSEKITRAMKYLAIGAKKGNKECKKILGQYYLDGKYVNKDIIKGKKLIEEGEKY